MSRQYAFFGGGGGGGVGKYGTNCLVQAMIYPCRLGPFHPKFGPMSQPVNIPMHIPTMQDQTVPFQLTIYWPQYHRILCAAFRLRDMEEPSHAAQ